MTIQDDISEPDLFSEYLSDDDINNDNEEEKKFEEGTHFKINKESTKKFEGLLLK